MDFDALFLSRVQFAFVVAFHILFPAFTIGLAAFLAVCEGLWLRTRREVFRRLYKLWVKVFALAFAMGVVSGVVLSYQFGTNWAAFSDAAGSVIGPLLAYEVLTAFFLEATFLGVMLFGWNKVGERLHFIATCAVAIGTTISAFWILSANSWMQTPAGHAFDTATGTYYAVDWLAVIFTPSFPSRLVHMLLAAYITTAAVVMAAGAWQVLKQRVSEPTTMQMKMAAGTLALLMPLQIWAGHWSGEVAHEHQPAKVAAIEGWCETLDVQPTMVVIWPDSSAPCQIDGIGIPGTSPFLFKPGSTLHGLDHFQAAGEATPPLWPVFYSFRVMVGAGLGMLLIGWWGLYLWRRDCLDQPGLFHWLAVLGGSFGFIAVVTGWMVAEIGRQPFTVYPTGDVPGMLTADSLSPVSVEQVATSLLVFMTVYAIIFTAGVVYMARIATRGYDDSAPSPPGKERRAPGTPLGAVDEPAEAPEDIVAAE